MTQFLAAPSYIYPTSGDANWARLVAAAAEVPIVLINPGSGPGGSSNSDYVAQVAACHAAGQKVIGYIHSQYTVATLASMESQIDQYYSWYGVDGIFIDEVTNTVGASNVNLNYYASLYSYIKGKSASAIVIINPGTTTDEAYMSVCDIVCNCESDLGFYRTRVAASWEKNYAPSRFWHILYAIGWSDQADGGVAQMYEALALSRAYGAGYVWITNDVETNPYDTSPSGTYWTDLLAQISSPTVLTGPFPVLEDGFDHDGLVVNTGAWSAAGSVSVNASYQLSITGHSTYADNLTSAAAFDFTAAGAASVEAVTVPSSASGEAFLQVIKDGSNLLAIGKSGSNLLLRYKTAGTSSDTTVTWNATSHKFWRINWAAGTVTWQTSPDRATWTTQRTVSSGLPTLTTATLQLICGHFTGGDPDQAAVWDNVIVGAQGSGTGGGLGGSGGGTNPGVFSLDDYTGSDDARWASALADLTAAGGGTIELAARAHAFSAQWATAYNAGVALYVGVKGQGAAYNGAWGSPGGATTVTFTYGGAAAAPMDFQHLGTIEIQGIWFKQANGSKPFMLVTNPAPKIHGNVFSGGGTGTGCTTDGILLGGTGTGIGGGDTAIFQGAGGFIEQNAFDGIRRIVVFQNGAIGVQFSGNLASPTCGSSATDGAPIEFAPVSPLFATGNYVVGNELQLQNYQAGIKCSRALQNSLGPNFFFNATSPSFVSYLWFDANSAYNLVLDGYSNSALTLVTDPGGQNTVITPDQNTPVRFGQGVSTDGAASVFTDGRDAAIKDGSGNAWQDFVSAGARTTVYSASGGSPVTAQELLVVSSSLIEWLANVAALVISNGGGSLSFLAAAGSKVYVGDAGHTASTFGYKGGFIVGAGALATNATDGFLYFPSCPGVPTGTPTAQGAAVPYVTDSLTGQLYAYISGAWTAV